MKRRTVVSCRSTQLHGRPEFDGLIPDDLPPPALDSDANKGPAEATTIRQGDPELSAVLAEAISHSGKIDRATHRFHTYPAGMHPDCAKRPLLFPGTVHDPFCGGGTVLVEGILRRRVSGQTFRLSLNWSPTRAQPISLWPPHCALRPESWQHRPAADRCRSA